jgi:hypothetical protein
MQAVTWWAILICLIGWAAHYEDNSTKNRRSERLAACRVAGGDGRFEMRNSGAGLFKGDLWCAHTDGTLFPVIDVVYVDR